jgi:hypothetical protein
MLAFTLLLQRSQLNLRRRLPFYCKLLIWGLIAVSTSSVAMPTHAWWDTGHEHITVGAIGHFPQPLRGFFEANLVDVRDLSGGKKRARGGSVENITNITES